MTASQAVATALVVLELEQPKLVMMRGLGVDKALKHKTHLMNASITVLKNVELLIECAFRSKHFIST